MKSTVNPRGKAHVAGRVERTAGADFRDGRRGPGLFVLGAAALLASVASAAPEPAAKPSGTDIGNLALSIQRVTLDNGLRVVLNVDKGSPNVAVCVMYDVGSRNEVPTRTGFAHLF